MQRLALISALSLLPVLAAAQEHYRVDLLGSGFVNGARITGLNNDGTVVGARDNTATGSSLSFTASLAAGVSTLPGFSGAAAINDHGMIAGITWRDGRYTATTYKDGEVRYLDMPGYRIETIDAINNHGVIAGSAWAGNDLHAIMAGGGSVADIGAVYAPSATSWAAGINDDNVVIGAGLFANGFVYRDGTLDNLAVPGAAYSWLTAINASGEMAGTAAFGNSQQRRPFLYSNGEMLIVGNGPATDGHAYAADINDAGKLIGSWDGAAYLYVNGEVTLLSQLVDDPKWKVSQVFKINEHDQIAAEVCLDTGGCQLALLTPVPEPATYGMLLAGLGIVGVALRRRQPAA